MTDRVHSLTIVLANDVRVDDIEAIETALQLIKGVISVGRNISDPDTFTAKERALHELRREMRDILWPKS